MNIVDLPIASLCALVVFIVLGFTALFTQTEIDISSDSLRLNLSKQVRSPTLENKWAQIASQGIPFGKATFTLVDSLEIPSVDLQFPKDVKNLSVTFVGSDYDYAFFILRNDGTEFRGTHLTSNLTFEGRRHEQSTQLEFMLTAGSPVSVHLKVRSTKHMSQDEVLLTMARIVQDAFKKFTADAARLTRESENALSWSN